MNVDVFYVHPDHLGTPRVVTRSVAVGAATTGPNAVNRQVWAANTDPFGTSLGNSAPNENPQLVTGTATVVQANTFRQNLAFPGQTRDAETGKAYNWIRMYDPFGGRYTQSDPIGLLGGISTFGYVGQRPTRDVDANGLESPTWPDVGLCLSNPVACAAVNTCRKEALASAGSEFPVRGGHNDEKDAYRHCYWSCCMAKRIGVYLAAAFASSHEMDRKNPKCERDMDMRNNGVGIGIGASGGDCGSECRKGPLQNRPDGSCDPCGWGAYK